MARYALTRLAQVLPVLALVSLLVFGIMHALPGDPAALMLAGAEGGAISPERLAELRTELGLDDPLPVQFLRFLAHALTGDLGQSIRFRMPVSLLVLDRFGATLELAAAGLAIALLVGVPLGVVAAMRQGGVVDGLCVALACVAASVPIFWLGLMLILLFSFTLGWLPPAGGEGAAALILPATALGLTAASVISRLVRSSMIEALAEDYIRTGRAKGLRERAVVWRHALRNALIPVLTVAGLQFGAMLAGAVVTETVFSRPGLGRLVVGAILAKDYPLVQGCVLLLATTYLLVNLGVDLLYGLADPRIRA